MNLTLLQRIEHIKFEPGILTEVLTAFEPPVKKFDTCDRDSVLFFDEMSIESRRKYDSSTQKYIGEVTIPNVNALAPKAEVFMLRGIHARWKITTAYHFIDDKEHPEELAVTVKSICQNWRQ